MTILWDVKKTRTVFVQSKGRNDQSDKLISLAQIHIHIHIRGH